MGLNRVQKRNLAIVLVSQAQQVIEEWDSFSQKEFPGVPEGALDEITTEDVRQRFAGWLQYLPGKPAAPMLLGEESAPGDDGDDGPAQAESSDNEDEDDEDVEELEDDEDDDDENYE